MIAPETAHVALDAALLVGSFEPRVAVEGIEAIVGSQLDEALGLEAVTPQKHLGKPRL
jgi:hypothetical protein